MMEEEDDDEYLAYLSRAEELVAAMDETAEADIRGNGRLVLEEQAATLCRLQQRIADIDALACGDSLRDSGKEGDSCLSADDRSRFGLSTISKLKSHPSPLAEASTDQQIPISEQIYDDALEQPETGEARGEHLPCHTNCMHVDVDMHSQAVSTLHGALPRSSAASRGGNSRAQADAGIAHRRKDEEHHRRDEEATVGDSSLSTEDRKRFGLDDFYFASYPASPRHVVQPAPSDPLSCPSETENFSLACDAEKVSPQDLRDDYYSKISPASGFAYQSAVLRGCRGAEPAEDTGDATSRTLAQLEPISNCLARLQKSERLLENLFGFASREGRAAGA